MAGLSESWQAAQALLAFIRDGGDLEQILSTEQELGVTFGEECK